MAASGGIPAGQIFLSKYLDKIHQQLMIICLVVDKSH